MTGKSGEQDEREIPRPGLVFVKSTGGTVGGKGFWWVSRELLMVPPHVQSGLGSH